MSYFSYVVGATRNSDFESSSHLVIIVFCFELSHLVTEVLKCFIAMNTIGNFKLSHSDIELLVCYWCIIEILSHVVIEVLIIGVPLIH